MPTELSSRCTMSQKHYQSIDDQQLIAMIIQQRGGWRDLLSSLLQRHHNALLTRCYVYLRNREDAEDATQETELRVFKAIRSFRGDSSFRTWLFAIGDRQCHDLVRKRRRQIIDDHLRALIEIHETTVNQIKHTTENNTLVSQVLKAMPEQERDVIVLRYYLDLSLQEISSTLGIGLSATKMRLYRALDKFSDLLHVKQHTAHA